jgi:quercetin dioxygenase-like cupin family protein
MRAQTAIWNDTTATVYHLDKGEKIARHQHTVEHMITVIVGIASVELWEETHRLVAMVEGNSRVLPARFDHEITAQEDGTIVLNMIAGTHNSAAAGYPADHGGVMLHDGTVVR